MANIINDGGVVGFTRVLTINAVTYTADDFKWDAPTGVEFTRTSNQSVPTGQVFVQGVTTGSCTLQLATSGTAVPAWGSTCVVTEGTIILTHVGRTENKTGETKVPVSFKLAITNSIVAS